MGPTQTVQPPLLEQPTCNNSPLGSEMAFEIKRIELPPDILATRESELQVVVSEIQKLAKLKTFYLHIPNYKRIWFEGPLSDKLNATAGTTASETNTGSTTTFLCVEREKYEFSSLTNWLEDRKDAVLSESQILHIIFQLASAVKFLVESGISHKRGMSLADIHMVHDDDQENVSCQSVPSFYPTVKVAVFNFEAIIQSLSCQTSLLIDMQPVEQPKSESLLHFMTRIFTGLLQRNLSEVPPSSKYPSDEWKVIQEMDIENVNVADCTNLVTKLQQLKSCYRNGFTYNIVQPCKNFIGRESELKNLFTVVTESRNKVIVIHGTPGIGKSELITQLSAKLLDKQRQNGSVEPDMNAICFDASSSDSLAKSLYNCANQRNVNIATLDYIGNPRLLKDIFLEMLVSFGEKDLLLVFENADALTVETLDLIQMFKETCTAQSSLATHHHLILITREIWSSCPLLEDCDCTTLSLTSINQNDAQLLFQAGFAKKLANPEFDTIPLNDEMASRLCDILQCNPAAIKIISDYVKSVSCNDLVSSIENFKSNKFPEIHHIDASLQPVCLAYAFVLDHIQNSLEENRKIFLGRLLYFLQFVDGETGICIDTLVELVNQIAITQCESIVLDNTSSITSLILDLRQYSLVRITDNVIRLPFWSQFCLKVASPAIIRKQVCDISTLMSAYYITLSSKSAESDCWKIMGHATKLWKLASKTNVEMAKRFDTLPELIAKLAKSFQKLELVAGFLKEATDIFSRAYNSSSDIHVLKLKFLLAVESLLPKGKLNEAFIVFKSVQEQCSLEPRECLMIKLKSLIELGKIHISRQEYEKAISCFQNVQVFSVQKISILQLDSEPTVLCSRLLHGHAHLQQGNLEEAKKIILQVIPLLERYSGSEHEAIKSFILQAKFYLAVILRRMGDLVNALMLQTKVLEERERIFGDKHPDTWASKQEMSMLFSSYDNHEKALLLLRQLLEIQEEVLGAPSNRHSLSTMNSIAEIEAKLGNFDDALELYEAIDLIEQQVLAESDEMRISSQLNQAEVLMSLGQYKEAIDIFDLVYTLRSTSEEKSSQNTKLLEAIQNKREKAERSMEVLGNYWLSLTPENVDDPSELAALAKKHEVAVQLTENQDNQGALRFLREVLEDCGHLEETNRFHLNVKADYARVLGLVGRFNESFSVYKEIIPLLDATFGETDELTMLCKDTMGQVFLFSGNQFLKRQMSNLKWFLL